VVSNTDITMVHISYDGQTGWGEFLQVSGAHVTFNLENPTGQRVKHLEVLCTTCDVPVYHVLKDTDTLKLVITDFLGTGGDGYEIFSSKPHVAFGINDMAAAEQYIKQLSPVYPKIEWRIQLENEDKVEPGSGVNLRVSVYLLSFTFVISSLIKSMLY
jgi:2',3'-cyclic-nucleotide 2'-phosphodiesterase (5'-nucleotidase family)